MFLSFFWACSDDGDIPRRRGGTFIKKYLSCSEIQRRKLAKFFTHLTTSGFDYQQWNMTLNKWKTIEKNETSVTAKTIDHIKQTKFTTCIEAKMFSSDEKV